MRGAEVPEDILSEEQCTKEPIQSGNAPEGEARIISAPTANQTSPGHATSALKCQGITASFLCCINGIQSTPNFSRDQCKGLSQCDICPITSPARHPRRAARGGWLGKDSSTALPDLSSAHLLPGDEGESAQQSHEDRIKKDLSHICFL